MSKMERKKVVLLTLVDDWQKLCKKSLSKLNPEKQPYARGFILGELNAILIMKKFIEEAWRK